MTLRRRKWTVKSKSVWKTVKEINSRLHHINELIVRYTDRRVEPIMSSNPMLLDIEKPYDIIKQACSNGIKYFQSLIQSKVECITEINICCLFYTGNQAYDLQSINNVLEQLDNLYDLVVVFRDIGMVCPVAIRAQSNFEVCNRLLRILYDCRTLFQNLDLELFYQIADELPICKDIFQYHVVPYLKPDAPNI